MQTIQLGADSPTVEIISGDRVRVELGQAPLRYYHHGWQSWSLAAWTDASRPLQVARPYLVLPQITDPAYAFHGRPHGSWVGAVEMPDGQVVLLGSLGLEAHVELDGEALVGTCETGASSWLVARGEEMAVFSAYSEQLGAALGRRPRRAVGPVWCSWYGLYTGIDEVNMAQVLENLGDLPFGVFQVDDGWQRNIGDWEPNAKFPSGMEALATKIKATGRTAGLWLAPLIATQSSRLFREHGEWFLRDERGRLVSAGVNWGEQLHALDTTLPEVREWLGALMKRVRSWGFDYIKLDFLYGGALPGARVHDRRRSERHEVDASGVPARTAPPGRGSGTPREAALREALRVLRGGMGDDAYFLACGSPVLPTLGICDALRIGPDVWSAWESERDAFLLHNFSAVGARNAIRTTMNRLWLAPLITPDPDVVYFRALDCSLTAEQKLMLQAMALICDFRATSDVPQWLTDEEREQLRQFLSAQPKIERSGPRSYRIDGREFDFGDAMELPDARRWWHGIGGAALGWLANHVWALKLNDWMIETQVRKNGARRGRKS